MLKAITRFAIPALLIGGVLAVLVALFSASRQPSQASGLRQFAKGSLSDLEFSSGKAWPTGRFEDANGEMISLASFEGPVVLNLWFEACPPCEAEMPSLGELQTAVADTDVKVVAVALDREFNREVNREALAEWTGGALDFYFDYSFGLAYDTGARGMPTTILYDRHGEEIVRFSGAADWASPEAVGLVREIAAR